MEEFRVKYPGKNAVCNFVQNVSLWNVWAYWNCIL